MAFIPYTSNSLNILATHLHKQFSEEQLPVFQPHYIVTQTEGMKNWLKLQLAGADSQRIIANLSFKSPAEILFKVYQLLGGRFTETFSSASMCWLFYKALGEEEFAKRFPGVADYIIDPVSKKKDGIRQMALAQKLADLFDQYQVYRVDMIREWNGKEFAAVKEEDWQRYVWMRVYEMAGDKFPDKTKMGEEITALLDKPDALAALKAAMPAIHLFGLSILTDYHIGILTALSEHIDVKFYLLNPSPEQYWFDTVTEKRKLLLERKRIAVSNVDVGNTLLLSLGKVINNSFHMLFANDNALNNLEIPAIQEVANNTLLQCIQADIFHNNPPEQQLPVTDEQINDGTIIIQSCYTIAREVESVYNYLVSLIDKKKELLSARDIVVMVTDINAYAPYIKAVFDNAPYRFPYCIADETVENSDNMLHALKQVLETDTQHFKAEQLVQLLDSSYIRRRFGITDLGFIRRMVDVANIRFGINGNKEDDTVFVSWKHGLKRLMYGMCMSGEELYEEQGEAFYPLDIVEGAEAKQLIRFNHFIDTLVNLLAKRVEENSLQEWVDYIKDVLHALVYEPGDTQEEDYLVFADQLQHYTEVNELIDGKFSFQVFYQHFSQQLHSLSTAANFATYGVTFCSMVPMRSLPFKVVAVLGLGFDKFPRKDAAASFNIMQQAPRPGDRNVKDNDKHLFLETLLCAKEFLYLSYVGQNAKDNSVSPPSAVVDELLDYIQCSYKGELDIKEHLIVRQPLYSFSRRYAQNPSLVNYLGGEGMDASGLLKDSGSKQLDATEEINLQSFLSFFKNPSKAYYNQTLGIWYGDDSDLLSETELFDVDGLQEWQLKSDLLTVTPEQRATFRSKLVMQGRLPLKNMAEVVLQKAESAIGNVKEVFQSIINGETEPGTAEINIELAGCRLTGTLSGIYQRNLVQVCLSKSENKYQMEAYIKYLVAVAQGVVDGMIYVSFLQQDAFEAAKLSKEDALQRLAVLVELYQSGFTKVLPFAPELKIEPRKVAELDPAMYAGILKKAFDDYKPTCHDVYLNTEYHHGLFQEEGAFEQYRNACTLLIAPLTEVFPTFYN